MATPLDALLRIRAQVTGAPAVQAMGAAIGGVQKQATGAVGALRRMATASGGLGGALGSLAPLLSAAGLGAMAAGAINAGDAMFDMSQRTGISAEMLGKFDVAARMSGTSIQAVGTGLARLARSMAAAAGSGFGDKTAEDMEKATAAIERGERDSIRAVENAANKRIDSLDRETGRRLDKLGQRYRREEQLLNDYYDDQAAAADEAAQDQLDAQIKSLDRRFEAQRRAIQNDQTLNEEERLAILQQLEDRRDAELEVLRDSATQAQTIRQRASRDARQIVLDELEERKRVEEEALKASSEKQKEVIKETARVQKETLKETSDAAKEALKIDTSDTSEQLEELGLSGAGASEAFRTLGVAVKNTDGTMRTSDAVLLDISRKFATMPDGVEKTTLAMKLFGRGGAEMIPMLNMGGDAIERLKSRMTTEFAAAADQYSDKLVVLGERIGRLGFQIAEMFLPVIEGITDALTRFFTWLDGQNSVIQGLFQTLTVVTIAFAALAPAILAVISVASALAPIFAGIAAAAAGVAATIAGWAGIVMPALAAIGTALAATFAAIATAPVLVTVAVVAAVAAVAAGIVLFQDEIGGFFNWLGGLAADAFNGLIDLGNDVFVQPFIKLWDSLRPYVMALWDFALSIARTSWAAMIAVGHLLFVKPWVELWNSLMSAVTALWEWVEAAASAAWSALIAIGHRLFVAPWITLWQRLLREPVAEAWQWLQRTWGGIAKFFKDKVTDPIGKAWTDTIGGFRRAWETFSEFIPKTIEVAISKVKQMFNSVISGVVGLINGAVNALNNVLTGYNSAASSLGLQGIPLIRQLELPALAQGGVTRGPTVALIGEGGEPEYVIPESKMGQASANYLGGARGSSVIPAFAEGAFVNPLPLPVFRDPRSGRLVGAGDVEKIAAEIRAENAARRAAWEKIIAEDKAAFEKTKSKNASVNIEVKTGPVLRFDGEDYVTQRDLERAMAVTADGIFNQLGSPTVQTSLGLR